MASITIELPQALSCVGEHTRSLSLQADTFLAALQSIHDLHPKIAILLFDERRALRPHVLCFLNQTDSRWLDSNQHPLHDGDVLLFMQAISGG